MSCDEQTMEPGSNASVSQQPHILQLPAEIRVNILEYVFSSSSSSSSFSSSAGLKTSSTGEILIDEHYRASQHLQPLLVCRQFYREACLFAFSHTHFLISNLFTSIPQRLQQQQQQQQHPPLLHPHQTAAIRSLAFVADKRHFRNLIDWHNGHPWGIPSLALETLTIILHRSSAWHYMFDFTSSLVSLLRSLRGVRRIIFVQNAALVKGSFRTWYNRLVGLMLKIDHRERYERFPASGEVTWWTWRFDDVGRTFTLEARPPKEMGVEEERYMVQMLPLVEELRRDMEREEWNPGIIFFFFFLPFHHEVFWKSFGRLADLLLLLLPLLLLMMPSRSAVQDDVLLKTPIGMIRVKNKGFSKGSGRRRSE